MFSKVPLDMDDKVEIFTEQLFQGFLVVFRSPALGTLSAEFHDVDDKAIPTWAACHAVATQLSDICSKNKLKKVELSLFCQWKLDKI